MPKALVVAATEIGVAVRSKAFLVGLLLLPVLMGGSIAAQTLLAGRVDTKPRRFVVVDGTGRTFAALLAQAEQRNARLDTGLADERGRKALGPRFEPEPAPAERIDDGQRLALADRVRRGDLFAFVELPADLLATTPPAAGAAPPGRLRYYSEHPTYRELPSWLEATVSDVTRRLRFEGAGLDPALIARLDRRVEATHLGLPSRAADGSIRGAAAVDQVRAFAVPFALVMMMFLIVMTSSPQLLNGVLEEKMSRVSEVLLGSVSPFDLMLGKLIGSAGVSAILGLLYLGGATFVVGRLGMPGIVPLHVVPAFAAFMTLAVFIYGSMFLAVGAACNELKDAQSLMTPIMLVIMLPLFALQAVIENPSSPFAVGMSLFPLATPFVMLLRMVLEPAPPAWQVALSLVLTGAATAGCVWAAGRIFRVGLLAQGKSASLGQMARWVLRG